MTMRLTLTVEFGYDDELIFAQQLGVDAVVVALDRWDPALADAAANRVDKAGLDLAGLELPAPFPEDAGLLGQVLVRAEAAGAPLTSCPWPRRRDGAVALAPRGRGGAAVEEHGEPAPGLDTAVPPLARELAALADSGDLRLALRTADLGSSLRDGETCARLLERLPEPLGLDLCLAPLAATAGGDLREALGAALASGRALAIQLRSGNGQGQTAFLDEGPVGTPGLLHQLTASGFDGPVRTDRGPVMDGDTDWGHKTRAFELGYLQAQFQLLRRA